jgi:hypothetical protein
VRVVKATYVRKELAPGWPILDESVPLGREYEVDLDDIQTMVMMNRATAECRNLPCIFVLGPGRPGYLPLVALKIEADG